MKHKMIVIYFSFMYISCCYTADEERLSSSLQRSQSDEGDFISLQAPFRSVGSNTGRTKRRDAAIEFHQGLRPSSSPTKSPTPEKKNYETIRDVETIKQASQPKQDSPRP